MGGICVLVNNLESKDLKKCSVLVTDFRSNPLPLEPFNALCIPVVGLTDDGGYQTYTRTGNIFHIPLPLKCGVLVSVFQAALSSPETTVGKVEHEPILGPQKVRILLVDDNQINQRIGCKLLQRMGLDADVAANGNEAVQMFQALKYDFVFMDVQMPIKDGITATKEIRQWEMETGVETGKSSVIIGLSAGFEEVDRNHGMDAGMNDYLTKPLLPKALDLCLRKWNDHVQMSETILNTSIATPTKESEDKDLLDFARLMEMAGHDAAEAEMLATSLLTQVKGNLDYMRQLAESGEMDGIRVKAHSIAGAAGTCGFSRISSQAKKLELQIINGEKPDFSLAFKDIEICIQSSREAFESSKP